MAAGRDAFDALQACLPAGTVSGAPKVRAMEIIDELEPHRRGPYAGAVGYVDFSGNMDTCIALRTLVVQGDKAYVQAGAGIVADSVPASEWQETLNKARGLLKAIELTERRTRECRRPGGGRPRGRFSPRRQERIAARRRQAINQALGKSARSCTSTRFASCTWRCRWPNPRLSAPGG